jgi:hypothetical protein
VTQSRCTFGLGFSPHLWCVLIWVLTGHSNVFAQSEPATSPSAVSSKSQAPEIFETFGPAPAKDLLPVDLLKSDHHELGSEAVPDGRWYRFTVNSSFGVFEAKGEDMLRIRVHEVQALAKMEQEMSQPAAFGFGVLDTVMSPFKFLWGLITDPRETLTGVPKGMKRVGSRISEMVTGNRGKLEDGEGQELAGFGGVKRAVAAAAGVNVYSSNTVLQNQLDRIAAAGYSGGVGSRIALIPVSGPIGLALSTTSFSRAMNEMLLEHAPEDLRRINRDTLDRIGVRNEVCEAFLSHPWYSPRHETILVQALDEMKGVSDRSLVLQLAMKAQSEEEALFVQRLVEMFASYHQTVVPLGEFILIDDQLLAGYTTDKALAVVLPLSHIAWSQELAEASKRVVQWSSGRHPIRRVELWTSGRITMRAHGELEKKGIMIFEKKRDRLLPPIIPEPLPLSQKVEDPGSSKTVGVSKTESAVHNNDKK